MAEPAVQLPQVIELYQAAHDAHDVEAALSAFADDATVFDEDQRWSGVEGIRQWLTKTSSEYTYTRTLLGAERVDDDLWLVRQRLEGNFPGGVVDLRYEFNVAGDHIKSLTIAP